MGQDHDHPLPRTQLTAGVERRPALCLGDELAVGHDPVFLVLADQAQELGAVIGRGVGTDHGGDGEPLRFGVGLGR